MCRPSMAKVEHRLASLLEQLPLWQRPAATSTLPQVSCLVRASGMRQFKTLKLIDAAIATNKTAQTEVWTHAALSTSLT